MFLGLHSCMSTQSAREHTERHAQETTEKKGIKMYGLLWVYITEHK